MARQSKTARLRDQERRAAAALSPPGSSLSTESVRLASELSISAHGSSQSTQALPPVMQPARPYVASDVNLATDPVVEKSRDTLPSISDPPNTASGVPTGAPPKSPSQVSALALQA